MDRRATLAELWSPAHLLALFQSSSLICTLFRLFRISSSSLPTPHCRPATMNALVNTLTGLNLGPQRGRQGPGQSNPDAPRTRSLSPIVETYEMLGTLGMERRVTIPRFDPATRRPMPSTNAPDFPAFYPLPRISPAPPVDPRSSEGVFLNQTFHTVPETLRETFGRLLAFQGDRVRAGQFRTRSRPPSAGRAPQGGWSRSRSSGASPNRGAGNPFLQTSADTGEALYSIVATFQITVAPSTDVHAAYIRSTEMIGLRSVDSADLSGWARGRSLRR